MYIVLLERLNVGSMLFLRAETSYSTAQFIKGPQETVAAAVLLAIHTSTATDYAQFEITMVDTLRALT
jgi:hypothetical protein